MWLGEVGAPGAELKALLRPYDGSLVMREQDGAKKDKPPPKPKKPKKVHEIGQDLSLLSVGDLTERIELLRSEIGRLEGELSAKGASKSAAEALFRR